MKIDYRPQSDLFKTGLQHIVHGCNAQGVMGSGVAGMLRRVHPETFSPYRTAYENNGNSLELGTIVWAETADGTRRIGHMITQENFGSGAATGHVYVDYAAVELCFIRLDAYFEGRSTLNPFPFAPEHCAMPLIGAGLAGGSWKKISEIIERRARNFIPVVYLLDAEAPTT